jgi:hypothetical protein
MKRELICVCEFCDFECEKELEDTELIMTGHYIREHPKELKKGNCWAQYRLKEDANANIKS